MPLITLRDVTLSFGPLPVLDRVNLCIHEKQRVCIVGRNGMGKSTLLKLLNGDIEPDQGLVVKQQQVVTARLEQAVPDSITGKVYDVIAEGLGALGKLHSRFHQLSLSGDDANQQEFEKLQHELDKANAWDLSYKIESAISRLGLKGDELFSSLSGGLKRRVLLGQMMVLEPNVLLLDEPTNHLDIESIEWLENFILSFTGTVIFISHDRTFLQKLATCLIEIDRGQATMYDCDYETYLIRKDHELEVEQTQNKEFDKNLQKEETWIRQGIKARRTRNEGRVRALQALRKQRQARRDKMGQVNMRLQHGSLSGKLAVVADKVSFYYNDKPVIKHFSTTLMRGDKVGIIGPNGIGKTTLIKLLLGQLVPTEGSVKHGTKLDVAYFDQLRSQLSEDKTVADNISAGDQFVSINGQSLHVMSYLKDFLFTPEQARTQVKALSGGERNRLLLAKLLSQPANLLVLDEPTNDLDLETLELLEGLLVNYQGTLLLVSHDRSFLNNVVTSTIVFEGEGHLGEYVGGYDDWLRQCASPQVKTVEVPTKIDSKAAYQTQKEIRALEKKIEKLENTQQTIKDQLGDPKLYESSQQDQLKKLQAKLAETVKQLNHCMSEWEQLQ